MSNINKINGKQKDAMAQFMIEHPNLAKNLLPNCSQGKATSKRLWEQLTLRLNSYGPPVKDAKSWRKVFADQKFNAKKKISFNKASKQKTGGGPYEEMVLTSAEEQIVLATGIDANVEGLPSVKSFGKPKSPSPVEVNDFINESVHSILEIENTDDVDVNEFVEEGKPRVCERKNKMNTKLSIVSSHVEKTEDYQRNLLAKTESLLEILATHTKKMEKYAHEHNLQTDRLLKLKERNLEINEEEHRTSMRIKEVELEIKSIELKLLKQKRM